MKALTAGLHVRVPDVIQELRSQRFGLVQTSSQYVYLHFSIATYCERKLLGVENAKEHLQRLKEFFAAYKDYANHEEMEDQKLFTKGFDVRNATNASMRAK